MPVKYFFLNVEIRLMIYKRKNRTTLLLIWLKLHRKSFLAKRKKRQIFSEAVTNYTFACY